MGTNETLVPLSGLLLVTFETVLVVNIMHAETLGVTCERREVVGIREGSEVFLPRIRQNGGLKEKKMADYP